MNLRRASNIDSQEKKEVSDGTMKDAWTSFLMENGGKQ